MLTENLSTLKIHKLTNAQYERELEAGNIDENALYLTPDEEIDLSPYATTEEAKTYADTGDTATLTSAKTYADTGDTATLTSAKTYTDEQVASLSPIQFIILEEGD